MVCVTSVSFSVHINGQIAGKFSGGRGLKQGDPLSPLLFVITMEYLSRLLHKTNLTKGFKFHPHCKALKLTHLMFANDLIIFSKRNPPTVKLIMIALTIFYDYASLKANMGKSQMLVGGCNPHL